MHTFVGLKNIRYTMADDADITKLPLEDRLGHKVNEFRALLKSNILEMIGKFRAYVKMVFSSSRCGKRG